MKERNEVKKRFYDVKDFVSLLDGVITRSQVYKMIADGQIPARRIGKKIVLSADWVNAYLNMPCAYIQKAHKNDTV